MIVSSITLCANVLSILLFVCAHTDQPSVTTCAVAAPSVQVVPKRPRSSPAGTPQRSPQCSPTTSPRLKNKFSKRTREREC